MDLRGISVSAYLALLNKVFFSFLGGKGSLGIRERIPKSPHVRMLTTRSDFNAVEAVVDVTHRYPELFYPKEQ